MRKSTSRHLAAGLAAALIGLAAAAPQPAAAEPVVIQWLSDNIGEKAIEPVWKEMIAKFEAEHPDIKIEPLPSTQQSTWTRFVSAAQAGEAPCVIEFKDVVSAAYAGYLTPIDELIAKHAPKFLDPYPKGIVEGLTYDGHLYGIPYFGGVYADVYNLDLVKAAGLDPANPPKTMDAYRAWMKALTRNGVYGTAIMAGRTDATTRALFSWIYANGGKAFNDGMTEATLASNAKSIEAMKVYLGLALDDGVVAEGATVTNYIEQVNLFSSGKIASMRQPYWSIAQTLVDNPAMQGKILVVPPPLAADGRTVVVVTANAISKDCKNPDEAWTFVEFANQPHWALERQRAASWMPMRTDVLDDPLFKDPIAKTYMDLTTKGIVYPLPHPAWNDIAENDIVTAVQSALLKQGTIEDVFTKLDRSVTKKLGEY